MSAMCSQLDVPPCHLLSCGIRAPTQNRLAHSEHKYGFRQSIYRSDPLSNHSGHFIYDDFSEQESLSELTHFQTSGSNYSIRDQQIPRNPCPLPAAAYSLPIHHCYLSETAYVAMVEAGENCL